MVLAWLTSLVTGFAALPVPFHQSFTNGSLDTAWQIDASKDNTVRTAAGGLRIEAAVNTYAHIQRPLGTDLIRLAGTLKPQGGVSWICSLFLYWDARNWCQVSVLEEAGSHYAVELIDGQLHEHRRPLTQKAECYRLAIALGEDCLRFQSSTDGLSWTNWLVRERPENWRGKTPTLLIVGKGFSRDEGEQHFTANDLDNDWPDRGPKTVSWVREVSVERTSSADLRLSEQEQKALAAAGRDLLGEAELAAQSDPSLASVSRHFPPMNDPREALGVKDGPDEFVVMRDGSLQFGAVSAGFLIGTPPVRFGTGNCAKRLWEGYLPIVVATHERDGVKFEQTAFGWSPEFSPDAPLSAFVRLRISNPGGKAWQGSVQFTAPKPVPGLNTDLTLPAAGETSVCLRVPFAQPASAVKIDAREFDQRLQETATWWRTFLAKGIKIHVPEERVNQAWRAWLAYNFINVDKRKDVYEPHDGGGGFYEEVYGYSAARYCHALDAMGFPEEAQRYLDSILSFVTPQGLLLVNYGLPDTGAQLWAMGQHYQLTRDAEWLRRVAPTMIRMCDWIIATRKSSMAQQTNNPPWRGMIKYRPYCDEPNPAYSYHTDTYLVLGMQQTAAALRDLGLSKPADRIARESEAYHQDMLASMDRSVLTRKGVKMLPIFPETHALLKRVGYTGADYYSLVSCMVLETGLLPANDPRARLITDLLERQNGLCLGACTFHDGIDHAYTYGYWINCLERDDVKRAILGLYTSLAYGMSCDTYAGVEVTGLRNGRNEPTLPHLYSGTQQLLLLRNLLLREEGPALWIGQGIPRPWLEDGKEVRVEDAPTLFGKTSYSIRSTDGARRMIVALDPPVRRPPERVYLRLRHPENRAIRQVTVNGEPCREFKADTVTLSGLKDHATIQVRFE